MACVAESGTLNVELVCECSKVTRNSLGVCDSTRRGSSAEPMMGILLVAIALNTICFVNFSALYLRCLQLVAEVMFVKCRYAYIGWMANKCHVYVSILF